MKSIVQGVPNPRLAIAAASGGGRKTLNVVSGAATTHDYVIDLQFSNVVKILLSPTSAGGTPPQTLGQIKKPIWTGGSFADLDEIYIYFEQDPTVGSWWTPDWETGTGGFSADAVDLRKKIDGTVATRTLCKFVRHSSIWCLEDYKAGISVA